MTNSTEKTNKTTLESGGAYEIIRTRLETQSGLLGNSLAT